MSDELETAYRDDLREQCEQISTSERRYTRIVVHVDEVLSLLNDAARLADAEEELSQWRATGESVLRNEHDLAARLDETERRIAEAPRMSITLRTNGRLDIKNIDALELTVGQSGVYRLVFDGTADSATHRETDAP